MERVLDAILLRRWVGTGQRFRPEVFRIGRVTAYLERDQVVLFVVGRLGVGVAVRLDLLCLEGVRVSRRRPDFGRVAADANGGEDVVLRDSGIGDPRSAYRVGQSVD